MAKRPASSGESGVRRVDVFPFPSNHLSDNWLDALGLDNIRLDSREATCTQLDCKFTTLHALVNRGLHPPPIKPTGSRRSSWPRHETVVIVAARIAGASDDDIRALVVLLVAARKKLLANLFGGRVRK